MWRSGGDVKRFLQMSSPYLGFGDFDICTVSVHRIANFPDNIEGRAYLPVVGLKLSLPGCSLCDSPSSEATEIKRGSTSQESQRPRGTGLVASQSLYFSHVTKH